MPGKPDRSLASMGIYVFSADYLYDALEQDMLDPDSNHDFGRDVLPRSVKAGMSWLIRSRRAASSTPRDVALLARRRHRGCLLGSQHRPHRHHPAAQSLRSRLADLDLPGAASAGQVRSQPWRAPRMALESTVSGGCIISGFLNPSLLFSSCRVHSYSKVDCSVLLPEVEVGQHARLTRTIVDHGCRIPDGLVVGEDPKTIRAFPSKRQRHHADHPLDAGEALSSRVRAALRRARGSWNVAPVRHRNR